MYESSGSQFFRTTTGIQLGPDTFVKLRFVMTFSTILAVTDIFYSFRLDLDGKMGKNIPESSRLQLKTLATNFALLDQKTTTPSH